MKNRLSKTGICTLLLFSMLIFPAEKLEAKIQSGTIGDNCTYTIDTEKKIMLIEGKGTLGGLIPDFWEYEDIPNMHWIIGEEITKIQEIYSVHYMESVQLPESLQIIDEHAFQNCIRLKSVVIPQGVNTIAQNAFEGCTRLKTITNLSSQTVYLPNHPSFEDNRSGYDYYVDGNSAVTVPPGKTAVGEARKYIVALESDGGTLSNYDKHRDIYFQFGEPLKLPKAKKKGYVFCGWTPNPTTNIAWYTITNEDTDYYFGSTLYWFETKKLFAQYAKVKMNKLGKRKLKVSLSKWVDTGQLEIQYSTNKKLKDAKSIEVTRGDLIRLGKITNKKKHYTLQFNKKKKTLSLTLNKLKPKKKYYFRFQYKKATFGWSKEDIDVVGDWFKKSVKM